MDKAPVVCLLVNATLSQYENDINEPNDEIKIKIADFFNITLDYLLGRTDSEELAVIENEEIPQELREIGVEYLEVNKELKEKGFTPEKIRALIKTITELNQK